MHSREYVEFYNAERERAEREYQQRVIEHRNKLPDGWWIVPNGLLAVVFYGFFIYGVLCAMGGRW